MANALLTGVSGLLAHQRLLEVVGHNIANMNTTGYKAQRATFSDLLYETIQPATSANEGNRGGTNPFQIGLGVKLGQIDRKFSQGSLLFTGEAFDLAMEGSGFFVVTDGGQDFYTRAGSFNLDEEGMLVAPGGLRVQRVPGIGEPDGINPSFQIPGESAIRIPRGASVPGVMTNNVTLTGNLDSNLSPPLATVKTSIAPFETALGNATSSTLLNDLLTTRAPYGGTDSINISGIDADGTVVNQTFAVSATTTVQDLVTAIDGAFAGVTASLQNGLLVMTANSLGPSDFELELADSPGNSGAMDATLYGLRTTVSGQWSDTSFSSITIYDERGGAHEVDLTFTKETDDIWRMTADMSVADGVISDNIVEQLIFNDDGTLNTTSTPTLTFQFTGMAAPQTVRFQFSANSGAEQLVHRPLKSDVRAAQDGSAPGVLVSANVESDGRIVGIASNGRILTIAQLAIASFRNAKGLTAVGNNLFERNLNSGDPEIGLAGTGDRGAVRGSTLENSNVDIAYEFTQLIVAQRGFGANARTITISDQVLEELTNIIR